MLIDLSWQQCHLREHFPSFSKKEGKLITAGQKIFTHAGGEECGEFSENEHKQQKQLKTPPCCYLCAAVIECTCK